MFSVDDKIPYRLYFGENKKIDFVDIRTVYGDNIDFDNYLFEDLSPIIKITQYEKHYILEIKKENSKWRFFYAGWPPQLKLVEPQLPQEKIDLNGKIIYERAEECLKK